MIIQITTVRTIEEKDLRAYMLELRSRGLPLRILQELRKKKEAVWTTHAKDGTKVATFYRMIDDEPRDTVPDGESKPVVENSGSKNNKH